MKNFLVPFAVGAGLVFLGKQADNYSDSGALPSSIGPYAAYLVGGVGLVIAHHVFKGA